MTQTQLAHAIGKADAQVSRWETGKVIPKRKSRELLAAALDVPAETFLSDD